MGQLTYNGEPVADPADNPEWRARMTQAMERRAEVLREDLARREAKEAAANAPPAVPMTASRQANLALVPTLQGKAREYSRMADMSETNNGKRAKDLRESAAQLTRLASGIEQSGGTLTVTRADRMNPRISTTIQGHLTTDALADGSVVVER